MSNKEEMTTAGISSVYGMCVCGSLFECDFPNLHIFECPKKCGVFYCSDACASLIDHKSECSFTGETKFVAISYAFRYMLIRIE